MQKELKKRDPFELLEQEVGINLMRTSYDFQQLADSLMHEFRLSQFEYNILRILRGSSESLSADEIVSRMVVRPSNANPILTALKKNGLIESAPGGIYRITSAGRDRLAAMDAPILDMHRQHLAHLSTPEKEELNRLLVRVRHARRIDIAATLRRQVKGTRLSIQ